MGDGGIGRQFLEGPCGDIALHAQVFDQPLFDAGLQRRMVDDVLLAFLQREDEWRHFLVDAGMYDVVELIRR